MRNLSCSLSLVAEVELAFGPHCELCDKASATLVLLHSVLDWCELAGDSFLLTLRLID